MKDSLCKLRLYATASVLLTILLLVGASSASADCSVNFAPDPLLLVSFDYYDAFSGDFLYSDLGSGVDFALTPFPNCVQLRFAYATVTPLALQAFAAPIQYFEFWLSQYLWVDSGGFVPFYPWVAPGALTVVGIDLTSGVPFEGTTAIVLTVFRINI